MAIRELFWFVAGIASAMAALVVAVPLWRAAPGSQGPRSRLLLPAGIAIIVIGAGIVLYMRLGAPGAIAAKPATAVQDGAVVVPHATDGMLSGAAAGEGAKAGSLDAAAEQLAQRLQRDGGSAADWELLAQSYDFLGRPADAQKARERAKVAPAAGPAQATSSAAPGAGAQTVSSSGVARATGGMRAPPTRLTGKAAELRERAEQQRRARDFAGAVASFVELDKAGGMDADTLADYADATASLQKGSLAGRPGELLARALKLDPDHPKALWLLASMHLEKKDYARALPVWEHLSAVLPPDSPDQRIVAANIAETRRLAGLPANAKPATAAVATSARIEGELDLAPALRAKVKSGTPLFIYAKAVDSPGPPLAVLRVATGSWPMRFALDDSMAMMPERRLSAFATVTVEARISPSGEAAARPGDLQGRTAPLDPRRTPSVRVVIDRPVT